MDIEWRIVWTQQIAVKSVKSPRKALVNYILVTTREHSANYFPFSREIICQFTTTTRSGFCQVNLWYLWQINYFDFDKCGVSLSWWQPLTWGPWLVTGTVWAVLGSSWCHMTSANQRAALGVATNERTGIILVASIWCQCVTRLMSLVIWNTDTVTILSLIVTFRS